LDKVNIIIYKITGRQLFFNVPSKVCEECDLTVHLTTKIIKEFNIADSNKINVEVKPWLSNIISAIRKRAFHPPVLIINGNVFSQGKVPDEIELKNKILSELRE
jgi:sporulation-control protein spo0M